MNWKWFAGSVVLYMAVRAAHEWFAWPLPVAFGAMFVAGGISEMWRALAGTSPGKTSAQETK